MRAKVVATAIEVLIDANIEDKCNKLDGVDQGLMDTKETQQDLKVFMDYDEKQRERYKLD